MLRRANPFARAARMKSLLNTDSIAARVIRAIGARVKIARRKRAWAGVRAGLRLLRTNPATSRKLATYSPSH